MAMKRSFLASFGLITPFNNVTKNTMCAILSVKSFDALEEHLTKDAKLKLTLGKSG